MTQSAIELSNGWSGVLRMDQYFGLWAMEDSRMRGLLNRVMNTDPVQHRADYSECDTSEIDAGVDADGIATLHIEGTMTKYGSSFSEAGSTKRAERAIRLWRDDPKVRGLLMVIDSPGGTVAGTGDLADEIAKFSAVKPVVSYIEDMGASAAYWVGSQANEVYANATALVGSIGVFVSLVDSSERAASLGYKIHVVKSAPGKGAGEDGTEIDEETLGEIQRIVDASHVLFVNAVARGRGVDAASVDKNWADGRCHPASEAESLGLIDGITTLEDARGKLLNMASLPAGQPQGEAAMARKFAPSKIAAKSSTKSAAKGGKAKGASASASAKGGRRGKAEDVPLEEEKPDAEDELDDETAEGEEDDTVAEGEEDDTVAEGEEDEPAAEGEEDDTTCEGEEDEPTAEDEEEKPAARGRTRPRSAGGRRPKAATIHELKAALPSASADFHVRCLSAGLSVQEAKDRRLKELEARSGNDSVRRGNVPLSTGHRGNSAAYVSGDPIKAFEAAVKRNETKLKLTRSKATAMVVKKQPELYSAYQTAVNSVKRQAHR